MKINEKGLNIIKEFEGFRKEPYKLAGEKYYTVGYGHYGPDVIPTKIYTEDECTELLKKDIERFENHVLFVEYTGSYYFNENEFSALVSFAYNVGNIDGLTNHAKRSRKEIREKILLYVNNAIGQPLPGLVRRRKAELALFNEPVDDVGHDWLDDSLGEIRR